MDKDEVVIRSAPLQVPQHGRLGLGQGPGAAQEWGNQMSEGEVKPFDKMKS